MTLRRPHGCDAASGADFQRRRSLSRPRRPYDCPMELFRLRYRRRKAARDPNLTQGRLVAAIGLYPLSSESNLVQGQAQDMLYGPDRAQDASKGITARSAPSTLRAIVKWTAPELARFGAPAGLRKAHSESAIRLPPGTISATAAYGPSLRIEPTRRPSRRFMGRNTITRAMM
jgi:hypothetical protein